MWNGEEWNALNWRREKKRIQFDVLRDFKETLIKHPRIYLTMGGKVKVRTVDYFYQNRAWREIKEIIIQLKSGGHCDRIKLQNFLTILLEQRSVPTLYNLRDMWVLFSRAGQRDILYEGLMVYVNFKATQLKLNPDDKTALLSNFQECIESICDEGFLERGRLVNIASVLFLKLIVNHPVELIVKEVDNVLSTPVEWHELEEKLEKVMVLYRTVKPKKNDKNGLDILRRPLLMTLYERSLRLRYLTGRICSLKGENYMVQELGKRCLRSERCPKIIKEIETSKEFKERFHQSEFYLPEYFEDIEIDILVIEDRMQWPSFLVKNVCIEDRLCKDVQDDVLWYQLGFEKYFMGEHGLKKFRWHHSYLSLCHDRRGERIHMQPLRGNSFRATRP